MLVLRKRRLTLVILTTFVAVYLPVKRRKKLQYVKLTKKPA